MINMFLLIRVILFIIMILIPGYLLTLILFRKDEISLVERIAITILTGISAMIFIGAVLGFDTRIFGGMTVLSIIIAWIILNIILTLVLLYRRRKKK